MLGVCSFKIEGRLKDQAYVQNVVAHYRQRLDAILPDLEFASIQFGRVTLDFEPDPKQNLQSRLHQLFPDRRSGTKSLHLGDTQACW